MWKGVIGVEVVVATVLALPLVKELEVLVANEVLVVAEAGAAEELVLDAAVVTVAVVAEAVESGACVLAGEGRMGRP